MKNTTNQWIKKLRASSPEERKDIALALGKIASDKAVIELKKMVEGRWKRIFEWYNFEDQLIGVEALGETGRRDVLEYLNHIYTPFVFPRKTGSCFPGDDGLPDTSEKTLEIHHYRNAPKKLIDSLSYSFCVGSRTTYRSHTTNIDKIPVDHISEREIQRYREEAFKRNEHQIFRKAIVNLEESIQANILSNP